MSFGRKCLIFTASGNFEYAIKSLQLACVGAIARHFCDLRIAFECDGIRGKGSAAAVYAYTAAVNTQIHRIE